ncbi:DnaB-like helicase C-terminal domain-containing protein [Macrococcus sp. DPC7161]|uniref:DnaB-like helicase C-terminal domain-containing protein n=1 Tax=Macrococcus sp. DPC7161 TaxID=2507060 RepID=UPI0013E94AFC|nr:DnaB-like helicase C-terminal domain-containing protein [Macrococcus sp. DPC7161]
MNNCEHVLIASIIRFPDLYEKLELQTHMFQMDDVRNTLELFNELGKADIEELYRRSKIEANKYITPQQIVEYSNDKLIFKTHFTNNQIEVLENYKTNKLAHATNLYSNAPNRANKEYLEQVIQEVNSLQIQPKNTKQGVLLEILEELTIDKRNVVKTGLSNLDKKIDGFEPTQLNIVGARPSMGKTAFALALGINMAKQGNKVHFVSIETSEKKVAKRVLSNLSGVPLEKFKSANRMTTEEMDKASDAVDVFMDLDLTTYDVDKFTPNAARNILSKDKSKTNVLIIDYIQLMQSDREFNTERERLEDISRQLKILAKSTKSIIIVLAQLNRSVEQRQDKRPMMSDLKSAGGLEQDADVVMMLYRDDYYNKEQEESEFGKSIVECIVAKNKDGETGIVETQFYKPVQRFF